MTKALIRKLLSTMICLTMILGLIGTSMPLFAAGNAILGNGFTVDYNINSSWEGNQNIGISVTNTGTEPIDNWAFEYDASGEITGLWGGVINSNDETTYIIENVGYNMEIKPGQTISFGYQLTGETLSVPSDFKLSTDKVVINEGYEVSFNKTSGWGSDIVGEMIIKNTTDAPIKAWELSFSSDSVLTNIWNASLVSSSDGNYTIKYDENSAVIQPGGSISIGMQCQTSNPVVFNDIKLSQVVVGEGSDIPVIVDPEEDYEIDTDGDGLPDYYEKEYGSDPENPDTDGDGLTDYEEVVILGTDPLKIDTDDNGILDPDEDPDEDGLTNRQELDMELDALSPDTDYDGLNDGDEVNIYLTDPLKYDTDGDNIGDGDEIIIGLDPNDTHTFGVHDSEYTFEQTISADSGALYFVNSEGNPFKLSIEITAAGNVEGNLSANESGYSNVINNDAVLGTIPGLYYNENLKVDSVRLKFEIDNEYIPTEESIYSQSTDELDGIKRLNIFKYFEDDNMLLPIETKYDEENNIIYTDVDELGTYCIMDMEKWFISLGIEPEVVEEEVEMQSFALMSEPLDSDNEIIGACGPIENISDTSIASDYNLTEDYSEISDAETIISEIESVQMFSTASNDINKAPADIVFILQATTSDVYKNHYDRQKNDILLASQQIFKTMPNARISVIEMNHYSSKYLLSDNGEQWAYTYDEVEQIISKSVFTDNYVYCDRGEAFYLVLQESQYRTGASRFVFLLSGGAHSNSTFWFQRTHQDIYNSGKYNYSEIKPVGWRYTDPAYEVKLIGWIEEMNGIYLKTNNSSANIISQHVFDNAISKIQEFDAITLTGLKRIKLDAPLKANSSTDSDKDGLTDWEEVDILNPLVTWKADGTIVLPTILDCINYKSHLTYVEEGLTRFINQNSGNPYPHLAYQKVLPIKSDPKRKDSDWDGFLDSIDHFSSYEELNDSGYFNISDPNPLKKEIIWEWPLLDLNGNKVERISSGFYEWRENRYDKKKSNYHAAIDIALDELGLPVIAAYDGTLKSIRTWGGGGCTITIEHNINGQKFTSSYLHMAYYDVYTHTKEGSKHKGKTYDNSNHEFIRYINEILEKQGNGKTFENDIWGKADISGLNIYVKAGTPIGVAAGTESETKREGYGIHLDFRIQEVSSSNFINPITFMKSLGSDKLGLAEYKCNMFINVPKDLRNVCGSPGCGCKDSTSVGEMYEIRKKYNIPYEWKAS